MPVAFENGIKRLYSADTAAVDRRPAGAAVPVGIVAVGHAVAVGVKVQVRHQLVADAGAGGAAHTSRGVGVAARKSAVVRSVAGDGGLAVAVLVVADGVQLRQGGNFNQAVVIGIVVGPVVGRFAGPRRDQQAAGNNRQQQQRRRQRRQPQGQSPKPQGQSRPFGGAGRHFATPVAGGGGGGGQAEAGRVGRRFRFSILNMAP